PAIAALVSAVILLTVGGVGGGLWQWQRAEARAGAGRGAHGNANLARDKAERALYFGRIYVAHHELRTGNQREAGRGLDAYRPSRNETDRRCWEWHYLNNLSRSAKLSFRASEQWVWDVAYSPDGRWLATAAGSAFPQTDLTPGEIALWDT